MNAEKGRKGEAPYSKRVGVLFAGADQDAPDQPAKIAHRERVSADSRRPVSRFGFAVGTGVAWPLPLRRKRKHLCGKLLSLK
jgi:hypothetical protein